MNLFDAPEGSKIRLITNTRTPPDHREFEDGEILIFSHIDGAYSLCFDENAKPVHLFAGAEVEIVED